MRLLSCILVSFRLTGMLVYDDGPRDAFLDLRKWAGVYRIGQDGRPETELGRLLSCPHCTGVYVSVFVAFVFYSFPEFLLRWLAIAGGQSFLELLTGKE